MAVPKLNPVESESLTQVAETEAVSPATIAELEALTLDADALASPARRLQHYLDSELGSNFGEEIVEGKWSARRTFAFIMVTCGLFWTVVWFATKALM